MTPIAPLITGFLREHMPRQRGYSPHTCETYAYSFRLLFAFAAERLSHAAVAARARADRRATGRRVPGTISSRTAGTVRDPQPAARRDQGVHALRRVPACPRALAQVGQIDAIPGKRHDQKLIRHLTDGRGARRARCARPDDPARAFGTARCCTCASPAGLRVSELVGAAAGERHAPARAERPGPRQGPARAEPSALEGDRPRPSRLAGGARGGPDARAVRQRPRGGDDPRGLRVYPRKARAAPPPGRCPTLRGRTLSPHLLRHSCAVLMLQATRDIRKVALWLGHADIRTTEVYLRMDPSEKLEAVEAVAPAGASTRSVQGADALIASLMENAPRSSRVRDVGQPIVRTKYL